MINAIRYREKTVTKNIVILCVQVVLAYNAFNNAKWMTFDNIFLECSIGYFGKDCATKCSYPVYGEDCQSICDCSKDSCHYSQGCLRNVETLSYQQLSKCLFGCTVK